MPPEDDVRLRHLVDAAERAIHFTAGRSRSDLDTDEMLTPFLIRLPLGPNGVIVKVRDTWPRTAKGRLRPEVIAAYRDAHPSS